MPSVPHIPRVDVATLSPAIKSALVERGYTEDQMKAMTPREAFTEYCEWNGLIRWGDTLWDQAKALIAMDTPSGAPGIVPVTDKDADAALRARVPGGSGVEDWFLPHEGDRAKQNVRDVVKIIFQTISGRHLEARINLGIQVPLDTVTAAPGNPRKPSGECIVFSQQADSSGAILDDRIKLYVDLSGWDPDDAAEVREAIRVDVANALSGAWADGGKVMGITEEMLRKTDEAEKRHDSYFNEAELSVRLHDVATASSGFELRGLIQQAFAETEMPTSVSFDYLHYGAWAEQATAQARPRLSLLCWAAWQREAAVSEFGADTMRHDEDRLNENADEIMRSYGAQWDICTPQWPSGVVCHDMYHGTINAPREDAALLESFGITLGNFDDETGAFYAQVPVMAFERLNQFPADFVPTLYLRRDATVVSDRDLEQYSVDELIAERAYLAWWLNGPARAEREVTKPSKITDMENSLYSVNCELASRKLVGRTPQMGVGVRDNAPEVQ